MFTGIISNLAEVVSWNGERLCIKCTNRGESIPPLSVGESVAINGVCLTLIEWNEGDLFFEVVPETVKKTHFKQLKKGDWLNIEWSLKIGGSVSGHTVQGHVDACGSIRDIASQGNAHIVKISLLESFIRYIVPKGSIAVNGVSLTVVEVFKDALNIAIIPHTWKETNFQFLKEGDLVNIEVDVMAKYVEKMVRHYMDNSGISG